MMSKIGNNDSCPCGSGKKYKKCCRGKMPRQNVVMVGSPVPLKGVAYDRDSMTFQGIDHDGRLVKPVVTYSQTQYVGQSGKEKVLSRIHDRVISHQPDLMKYMSSFDLIIAVDTNTRVIDGDAVSVSGIVHCRVQAEADPKFYSVELPWHGFILFRNCPHEISPEIFGWVSIIEKISHDPVNAGSNICLISDHDRDNHGHYNSRQSPIFRQTYLPPNVAIMYGKGDSSKENLLNYLVQLCDKESTQMLMELEQRGCCRLGNTDITVGQIPVPEV